MAAKKKTTKKAVRKTARKTPARRPAASAALEERLSKVEGRLAALDAQPDPSAELRELRLALLPALEAYRTSRRVRKDQGVQLPYVYGGTIVIILIVVAVLASNGHISADATVILVTGLLVYAISSFREYLFD